MITCKNNSLIGERGPQPNRLHQKGLGPPFGQRRDLDARLTGPAFRDGRIIMRSSVPSPG